jgi:poly-D-alanine transfer protein DltD
MLPKNSITQQRAKEAFDYKDGELIWIKPSKQKPQLLNQNAGYLKQTGYKELCIDGIKIMVHRVIYIWHFGEFEGFLDHKNGDIKDNRIENLRIATKAQNNANVGCRNNKSGVRNVYWRKDLKKWQVSLRKNKKSHHLGYFVTIEEAQKVAEDASMLIHGEFSPHKRSI